MSSGSLLDATVVLAPGVVLERSQTAEGPNSARLRAEDQIAELGPDLGELVARLRGDRLGVVVEAVLGPGSDEGRGQLTEQITAITAQLLQAGFLVELPRVEQSRIEQAGVEPAPDRGPHAGKASSAPRRRDLPLDAPDRAALEAAGRTLRRAGFSSANLHALLSHPAADELTVGERAIARRRLDAHGEGALPLLTRAFVLDDAIEEQSLRAALGDAATATLLDAGLLRQDGVRLEPTVRVATYAGPHTPLLLAHDGPAAAGRDDMVPGLHRPSITLADFTPRRPVESALDMGTGNGLQALLLAGHAQRVVATDVNPRAVGYAAVNAGLNDVLLDVRVGSLLEPVQGETFDLLVSNPPYVLSPETELVFRDSGYPGDSFNKLVATTVADVLNADGAAVVLVSWSQPPTVSRPRPLQWLDDAAVDADGLLVLTGMADALTEAASWNREFAGDPGRYAQQMDRWLGWYAEQGIEQIGYGALTLRRQNRRGSPPWRFALPGEPRSGSVGDHVERILTGHAQLASLADAAVLQASLRLQDGCRIRATRTSSVEGWQQQASIGIEPGLGITAPITSEQEQALWRLSPADGRPVSTLAELLPSDALAAFVRGLVEAGFAVLDLA